MAGPDLGLGDGRGGGGRNDDFVLLNPLAFLLLFCDSFFCRPNKGGAGERVVCGSPGPLDWIDHCRLQSPFSYGS